MGLMRFCIFPPSRVGDDTAQQAYLSGIDRIAWPVRARTAPGELTLERMVSDSGALQMPWPVEGRGTLALTSGTLIEQPRPYLLPLELARGTVNQLRSQLAEWQVVGLQTPQAVIDKLSEAVKHLGWAAVSQDSPEVSARRAEQAIRAALHSGDLLTNAYTEQVFMARRRGGGRLPALLAADLGNTPLEDAIVRPFLQTFNSAVVPMHWRDLEATEGKFDWTLTDRQIEWCQACGLKICSGPLLRMEPYDLPDWVYLWEDDFDNLLDMITEYVETVVTRYRGRVNLWQCAARLNTSETLSLSEQERLRLAARTIELVRTLDPATPAVIAIDQPWAEYMGRRESDFPPLHFADALVRAGLDLKGIVLEINLGYVPGGTLPRTTIDLSRQLDSWSLLGLPVLVAITIPSGDSDDPLAQRRVKVTSGNWSPAAQQAWAARWLPLILAKPYVHTVIWNQLRDSQSHEFPHGGLFDAQRQPKPVLRTLAAFRQTHLK